MRALRGASTKLSLDFGCDQHRLIFCLLLSQEQEKTPFSWQEVIMKAVVKKGEISLTRLRKKCVSEFVAAGRYMRSEERLWRKLDSQLASLSRAKKLVVKNDKIMLPNRVGADE